MDTTDLNKALHEIGMLSEPAAVKKDEPRRKSNKAVATPKPAHQLTAFTSTTPSQGTGRVSIENPRSKLHNP